jgi:hypothetical protein
MVRDPHVDNSTKENDSSTLFYLSKPLKTNFILTNLNKINLNMSNNSANGPSIADQFTFVQPNESNRFNNEFRIQKQKLNSNRAQPYTLTRPTNTHTSDSTATLQSASHDATSSTNNAVMARLSSMSSTFKSMFVKPKNSKHVDISAFQNKKTKLNQENEFKFKNESINDYLLKLSQTANSIAPSIERVDSLTSSHVSINPAQIPVKNVSSAKFIQANDDFLRLASTFISN